MTYPTGSLTFGKARSFHREVVLAQLIRWESVMGKAKKSPAELLARRGSDASDGSETEPKRDLQNTARGAAARASFLLGPFETKGPKNRGANFNKCGSK